MIWTLRFNAGSTSPYKWEYVGGTSLFDEVDPGPGSAQTTSSNSYTTLATPGPAITVPIAGDYDVQIGAQMFNGAQGGQAFMSYQIGATPASDADSTNSQQPGTNNYALPASTRSRRKTGISAGSVLSARYAAAVGISYFAQRWMRVTPIRVG